MTDFVMSMTVSTSCGFLSFLLRITMQGVKKLSLDGIEVIYSFSIFKGEYITKENGNEINKVTIKDDDDGTFRVSSGGGLEIYPVQDITGLMYGTFIGVNAGFELDYFKVTAYDFNQVYRDSSMVTGFINLFCKFEIGKEWRMNRLWNYGFALNYTISWLRDKNEHYSYTKVRKSADRISHKSHTFGLTFRLSH